MIASSRKKTDKRDAYWIAKALASGMTPHPVTIPNADVQRLRSLLKMRTSIVNERKRGCFARGMSAKRSQDSCQQRSA